MKVFYTDFSNSLGFDYRNEKPLFTFTEVFVIVEVGTNKIIRIKIPKGFRSDGCTLKFRILWLLFGCPHTGKYIPASIIHDYLLKTLKLTYNNIKMSSLIFRQVFLNEKVNIFTSNLMYLAVLIYQTLKILLKNRKLIRRK